MKNIFNFEVPGKAVPQARPAASFKGGKYWRYDPVQCREYKNKILECLKAQCGISQGNFEYTGAVKVEVIEYRKIPKSWSKIKQMAARANKIRPVSRPDTDNILKIVKDALNGVLWKDDAQVVSDKVEKFYSQEPRLVVSVEYLNN